MRKGKKNNQNPCIIKIRGKDRKQQNDAFNEKAKGGFQLDLSVAILSWQLGY